LTSVIVFQIENQKKKKLQEVELPEFLSILDRD